jgi:hypothetical protein
MTASLPPPLQPSPPPASSAPREFERRVLAILAVFALHGVILVLSTAAVALARVSPSFNPAEFGLAFVLMPREPLLLTAVALITAQCSLGAVWWVRSHWPSYARTLAAVLAFGLLFGLLLLVLEQTRRAGERAAGWIFSLGAQTLLVAFGVLLIQLVSRRTARAGDQRYTILTLLLWTAVVGIILASGRWLAALFGWTPANFFTWVYFLQVMTLGIANALVAVAVVAALDLPLPWVARSLAATGSLVAGTIAATLGMYLIFEVLLSSRLGASVVDIAWLVGMQGLFVLVTLLPLAIAADEGQGTGGRRQEAGGRGQETVGQFKVQGSKFKVQSSLTRSRPQH